MTDEQIIKALEYEHDSPEYITPYCPHCGAKMDEEE